MTNQKAALNLLCTLYRLANRGKLPTVTNLCIETGQSANCLVALLDELDRKGLVDREWPRLTLSGLAVAVAAGAKTKSKAFSKAA